MDTAFPLLTLDATLPSHDGGQIIFQSRYQLLRSEPKHVQTPDTDRGLLYISLGNGPSRQPFHGWVFEIDLDAWHDGGAGSAVTARLVTTAENECTEDAERLATMVCGGGIWTPAGPLVSHNADGSYELIIPTGNGRVDFDRRAYAHSLLRTGRDLAFEPNCEQSCSNFDEFDPDPTCLASCRDIFVARMPQGQSLSPDHSLCENKTFLQCYGVLDADLGSSAPVEVQVPGGPKVFVQPGKDGGLYLVDAEHLGTLYDRKQMLPMCGTDDDECKAIWTGQFVTQPVVSELDGVPLVIVSGFMFDETHPAGVVAAKVQMSNGTPELSPAWQTPRRDDPEATQVFRRHTGRPTLHSFNGKDYIFVVEPRTQGGVLWVIRASDGATLQRLNLSNDGVRYSKPAIHNNTLFVGTCEIRGIGEGRIEAFKIYDGVASSLDASVPDGSTSDAGLCEPGGATCEPTEYCDRGRCGGPGLCTSRPTTCATGGSPVCGCDGSAYSNECEAHRAGVDVDPDGVC